MVRMRCSVFEEGEETPGWEASRRVARCEPCLREMMENEVNELELYQEVKRVSVSPLAQVQVVVVNHCKALQRIHDTGMYWPCKGDRFV